MIILITTLIKEEFMVIMEDTDINRIEIMLVNQTIDEDVMIYTENKHMNRFVSIIIENTMKDTVEEAMKDKIEKHIITIQAGKFYNTNFIHFHLLPKLNHKTINFTLFINVFNNGN